MNFKNTLYPLSILLISQFSFAQINDFKLSDFKLPDFNLHALDADFSLSQVSSVQTPFTFQDEESEVSNFGGFLDLDYQNLKNNATWQKATAVNTFLRYSKNNQKNNNRISNGHSFTMRVDLESTNRKYYSKDHFIEFDARFFFLNFNTKSVSNLSGSVTEYKAISLETSGFIPIKIGKGRIENVSDAQHAIFILEALRDAGKINKEVKSEDILAFSELITQIKNKRFFDFRLRRIAELEVLDTFLIDHQLVNESDIRYFTTLNDIWIYGANRDRKSGYRFSVAMYPGVLYQNNSDNGFSEEVKSEIYNLHGGLEFVHDHPINLRWQNSFNAYAYVGILNGTSKGLINQRELEVIVPKFNIGLSNKVAFFPNTRTALSYTLVVQHESYANRIDFDNDVTGYDGNRIFLSSIIEAEYFISPRFSLSVYSDVNFNNFRTDEMQMYSNNNFLKFSSYPNISETGYSNYFSTKKGYNYYLSFSIDYNLF